MRVLIVGAGITGCTVARSLGDKGHDIEIFEKRNTIGGLCETIISPNGIYYEPYGARTFHTKFHMVKEFVTKFAEFNSYIHRKGTIVEGTLRPFPISLKTINEMPQREQILRELKNRPRVNDEKNFETCMISLLGPTLYRLFIYKYTKKMWGINPKDLSAEWAPKRLELRDDSSNHLFLGQWQGLPIGGYTTFLEKMVENIPTQFGEGISSLNLAELSSRYDVIVYSGQIDEICDFCHGKLPYRSLHFEYRENEPWENDTFGTINLPEDPLYIRKANFKILHQQVTDDSWIQYQQPIDPDKTHVPMYPVNTPQSEARFQLYLRSLIKNHPRLIPTGRLGLFKYLDMDKAVKLSLEIVPTVELWNGLESAAKLDAINAARSKSL